MTIRQNLFKALAGEAAPPVYLVYDWFVHHRAIDWSGLFNQGLGRIHHVSLVRFKYPHLQIVESESVENGRQRKDVRWITDSGELHEYYLDGWKQQHLIRSPEDYRIARRAFEDAEFTLDAAKYEQSETALGESGITLGQFGGFGELGFTRTPFQVVQIDLAGLEQFSLDIAVETPQLLDLLDSMNEQLFELFRLSRRSSAVYLKLWENLSIETMGPRLYQKHLVPLYEKIFQTLEGSEKKLIVHYDGKLNSISDAVARLPFHGIDSLTPPPEGDMTIAQARAAWPEKFFWIHPTLSWDNLPMAALTERIRGAVREAGSRFCFELSEEVPPNWQQSVPRIIETLREFA